MQHLAEHCPQEYNTYFEPFVGSGALFFYLKPESAILSDLNSELINFYDQVKLNPSSLLKEMMRIPRTKDAYLKVRCELVQERDRFQRAVQFGYLNRNCFNGLYRTNKLGHFNVPYAERGRSSYPTECDFISASNLLKSSEIKLGDFRHVLHDNVSEGDFVYLDPPYLKSEGRIFSEYVLGHFSSADLDDLHDTLRMIDSRGAKFIMSFVDDPIIESVSSPWKTLRYEIQRNIAGFAGARKRASEVLVKNW